VAEQAINYQIVKVHLTRIADIALSPLEEGEAGKSNEEPDFTKPMVLDRVSFPRRAPKKRQWEPIGTGQVRASVRFVLGITNGEGSSSADAGS
jgi:hypothetical protein